MFWNDKALDRDIGKRTTKTVDVMCPGCSRWTVTDDPDGLFAEEWNRCGECKKPWAEVGEPANCVKHSPICAGCEEEIYA